MDKIFFVCISLLLYIPNLSSQDKNRIDEELQVIYERDQSVRRHNSMSEIYSLYKGKPELKEKMDSVFSVIREVDTENQKYVGSLLDSIGWLSGLSEEANLGIFLVIDHANMEFIKKYYDITKRQAEKNIIPMSLFSNLHDRLLMKTGKSQTYGTQTISFNDTVYVWPVENAEHLDQRREEIQLMPMSEYMEMFKTGQNKVVWDKNMTVGDFVNKYHIDFD